MPLLHPLRDPIIHSLLNDYLENGWIYSASEIVDYLNERQNNVIIDYRQVKSYLDYHSAKGGCFSKQVLNRHAFFIYNGQP